MVLFSLSGCLTRTGQGKWEKKSKMLFLFSFLFISYLYFVYVTHNFTTQMRKLIGVVVANKTNFFIPDYTNYAILRLTQSVNVYLLFTSSQALIIYVGGECLAMSK